MANVLQRWSTHGNPWLIWRRRSGGEPPEATALAPALGLGLGLGLGLAGGALSWCGPKRKLSPRSGRGGQPAVIVLKPLDIVLAQPTAPLHLDDLQAGGFAIGLGPVDGSHGDEQRGAG
jgi:hypothetical protein